MAKELNATCQICGKKYHMCRTCESHNGTWESWMQHTDTKDCFKIYTILYSHRLGEITDADAKNQLQKCDLSELETFKDNMKALIKSLLGLKNDSTKEEKVEVLKEADVEESEVTEATKIEKPMVKTKITNRTKKVL